MANFCFEKSKKWKGSMLVEGINFVSIIKLIILLLRDAIILGRVIDGGVERTLTENRYSFSDWEGSDGGENWICLTFEPDKHAWAKCLIFLHLLHVSPLAGHSDLVWDHGELQKMQRLLLFFCRVYGNFCLVFCALKWELLVLLWWHSGQWGLCWLVGFWVSWLGCVSALES